MEKSALGNATLEERLLEYIDVPYFQNNPAYIELWRRYYNEQNRDPQILLLMYHKRISVHYHWIYIEFSKHFVKQERPEIAHFILADAIKRGVYDKSRLGEALFKIPPFERRYSRGDIACILNQKNIRALGRVWNRYEECEFYKTHLEDSFVNFDMMKTCEFLLAKGISIPQGQRNASCNSIFMEVNNLEANNEKAGEAEGFGEITGDSGQQESLTVPDTAVEEEIDSKETMIAKDHIKCRLSIEEIKKAIPLETVSFDASCPTELLINDTIHLIQETLEDGYITMSIANNADLTQTIAGKQYCLKRITLDSAAILNYQRDYRFCIISEDLFVIFEFDSLGPLEKIIEGCAPIVHKFYAFHIFKIFSAFTANGVVPYLPSFFVDSAFQVRLFSFTFSKEVVEAEQMYKDTLKKLNITQFSLKDFLSGRESIENEDIVYKKAMLKHRADVYNSI